MGWGTAPGTLDRVARAPYCPAKGHEDVPPAATVAPGSTSRPTSRESELARLVAHAARGDERAEGRWQKGPAPGIETRPIFADGVRGTVTALVRMASGSTLPRHHHATPEQFYVLGGAADLDGQRLAVGDYYRAPGNSSHGASRSEGGCTFLLISSRVELRAG